MLTTATRNIVTDVLADYREHEKENKKFDMGVSFDLAYHKHSKEVKAEALKIYEYFGVKNFSELNKSAVLIESKLEKYKEKISNLDNPRMDLSEELLPKWWFDGKTIDFTNLRSVALGIENLKMDIFKMLIKMI